MNSYQVTTFLLAFFLLVAFASCRLDGVRQVSSDIPESRRRHVFVCEYYAPDQRIKINDTLSLYISRVWAEKQWGFDNYGTQIRTFPGYQLIVESDAESLRGYSFTWNIGVDYARYFRSASKTSIMTDMDSLHPSIEKWLIQSGTSLNKKTPKNIIGELVLQRKQATN